LMNALHLSFLLSSCRPLLYLPSFPTRRSSDLFISSYIRKRFINQPQIIPVIISILIYSSLSILLFERVIAVICSIAVGIFIVFRDRKSTRLNSSHVSISYAVFCLKKENR